MTTYTFTPDQRDKIKTAALNLLADRDNGRRIDPLAIEWAENILRMNPGETVAVPPGDDLEDMQLGERWKRQSESTNGR
jgi:hypothetical protein